MRLCCFLFLLRHRRHELTDAIPYNTDAPAVDTLRLADVNLLYEFPDDLGGQFPDVGILLYQVEEPLHIDIGFLLGCNYAPQLGQWASSVICSFS